MKKFLIWFICGIVMLCFTSCNNPQTENNKIDLTKAEMGISENEKTENSIVPATPAFDTDNVSGITFYGYHDYGTGKGSKVPQEYMDEIIDWLNTFTVGEKAPDLMPPGTNSVHIEIVYYHGIIFESGLDTVRLDDGTYCIKRSEAPPECYYEIMSGTD